MLDQNTAGIKKFVESDFYDLVVKIIIEQIEKVQNESGIGNNNFQTLRNTFTKEGKIMALKDLINYIDGEASK